MERGTGQGAKAKLGRVFLGKDHLKVLRLGGERDSKAHWQCKQKRSTGSLIPLCLTCLRVMGASLILKDLRVNRKNSLFLYLSA